MTIDTCNLQTIKQHVWTGHAKRLKRIFKEMVKVLSDLQDFNESLLMDQILAMEAQKCISNTVSVVFGDTFEGVYC